MKDQLSAKRLKALVAFFCLLSLIDEPLWRAEQHFQLFCFSLLVFTGSIPPASGCTCADTALGFPTHRRNRIGCRGFLPVQHTVPRSQVHTKAPRCAKWREAPFVCQSWAEAFRSGLEERSDPPALTVPVSSLHLLLGEKRGGRGLRKSLSSVSRHLLSLSLFLIETMCPRLRGPD